MKIGIVFIGTNQYRKFFEGFHTAHEKYFLPNLERHFFAFTDNPSDPVFNVPNLTTIQIEHEPWPFVTLNRFKYMLTQKENFHNFDWIFYIDADLWSTQLIGAGLLGHDKEYIGVQHPGFLNREGAFENNPASTACTYGFGYDLSIYRQGCFWGAKKENFIHMIETCYKNTEIDKENGIIATWHDESHINKYFLQIPDQILTVHPGYACPQSHTLTKMIMDRFPLMMIHLSKDFKEYPRFAGGKW